MCVRFLNVHIIFYAIKLWWMVRVFFLLVMGMIPILVWAVLLVCLLIKVFWVFRLINFFTYNIFTTGHGDGSISKLKHIHLTNYGCLHRVLYWIWHFCPPTVSSSSLGHSIGNCLIMLNMLSLDISCSKYYYSGWSYNQDFLNPSIKTFPRTWNRQMLFDEFKSIIAGCKVF